MDRLELAKLAIEWNELVEKLYAVEGKIRVAILNDPKPKTQVVGHMRARYSKGRRVLDYKTAAIGIDPEILARHTTPEHTVTQVVPMSIDYAGACAEANITEIPALSQAPASVTFIYEDKE